MKLKVWTLYHNIDGDGMTRLFISEEAARCAIQLYVADEWAQGVMDGEVIPVDLEEAAVKYFEAVKNHEYYDVGYETLDFPIYTEGEVEEEITLSSEECMVILAALRVATYKHLKAGLGDLSMHTMHGCASSAIGKLKA